MSLIDILRKPSTIHLFFATIFLIPFQTALLYPFTIDSLSVLQDNPESLFHYNPVVIVVYLLLPIIYCIILSLLFVPKKIVNPLHIQVGAFALYSTFLINYYLNNYSNPETFQNIFGILVIIAMYIIMIGFFQFISVRWVVGLIYEGCDRKTFIINGSPKEIMKNLGKEFLRTRNFKKPMTKLEKTDNPITILRYEDASRNNITFAFGSLQEVKNKCILSTVAFHKSISLISKSLTATAIRDAIIRDIKGRLEETNSKFKISSFDKVDNSVSEIAFSFIESISKSKIEIVTEFFRKMPSFYRWLIYLTSIIILVLTVVCYIDILDFNIYITIITPLTIALIFGIGTQLIKEFTFKKVDGFS